MSYNPKAVRIVGQLIGANFNTTADQPIAINAALYRTQAIIVTNASISLTTAAGGFYTAASKGGTAVVAAGQVYSSLTTAAITLSCTLNNNDKRAEATIYFSLTTAQGAAATADIYIIGQVLTE